MPDVSEKFRCFIAIPIDATIVNRLRAAQDELASGIPADSVRWTTPEQLHLTLKFLGSVPAGALNDLEAAFRSACEGAASFSLTAQEMGAFPSMRNPRILWVGLAGDVEPLLTLQGRIAAATSPWAQKSENRAFHPHLTLGRVRENAARHARRIGEQLDASETREFGSWRVREARLMRSQLSPKGGTYTALVSVSLG